jgi:ESS family glutamate:Na+ symporter
MNAVLVPDFLTVTRGLLAYLAGVSATRRITFLRYWNIPEPVTGGLMVAFIVLLLYGLSIAEISFEMETRDMLLVVFFTTIGLNARISDLLRGGRILGILLGLTLAFLVVQDIIGTIGALVFGFPSAAGVLLGSASLMGGHGTAIAWGPEIAARGVEGAAELGIAAATLGLVAAGLVGGPIAKILIEGRNLKPSREDQEPTVGLAFEDDDPLPITAEGLMRTILVVNITIMLGWLAHQAIIAAGITLPLFVPCLMVGILIGNLLPVVLPSFPPVSRTPVLALIADYSLGVFLVISLMSLQLWTLAGLGGPLILVLVAQAATAIAFVVFVLFPLLGGDYRAAVLGAGFGGFALGATPTAIANMTAVTKRYGPSPTAFVVLPIVSAFFVDIANAFVIQVFLMLGGG